MHLRIAKVEGVCGGSACIKGTRIPVWLIEAYRRSGIRDVQALQLWPSLVLSDLEAAYEYARTNRAEIDRDIEENRDA